MNLCCCCCRSQPLNPHGRLELKTFSYYFCGLYMNWRCMSIELDPCFRGLCWRTWADILFATPNYVHSNLIWLLNFKSFKCSVHFEFQYLLLYSVLLVNCSISAEYLTCHPSRAIEVDGRWNCATLKGSEVRVWPVEDAILVLSISSFQISPLNLHRQTWVCLSLSIYLTCHYFILSNLEDCSW